MKTTLFAAALAFTGLAAILPAHADSSIPQVRVAYGDLNLSHPAGAQTMLNRINEAASRVCGGIPHPRELMEKRFYRTCVRAATDNAVAQLNAPLVTALHTGQPITDPRFARTN